MTAADSEVFDILGVRIAPPRAIEDGRFDEDPRDFAVAAAAALGGVFDAIAGTPLETHAEGLLWGVVNVVHRKIDRLEREIDALQDEIRLLAAHQDGSEVLSVELERKIARAAALLDHARAFEEMRDGMSAEFSHITGSAWLPKSGSRRAGAQLTSAILDARDLARALEQRGMHIGPERPKIGFAGGADWTDVEAIFKTLNKVKDRRPDMVLCHGGQDKGAEKIAARWAEARGVPQIVFRPDFARDGKAAPFRRNDAMIAAGLAGVMVFPGTGITLNLAQKAEKAGVSVLRCGGEAAAQV